MRRFAIGLLASSLMTLLTAAQADGLGAHIERALAAPSPEKTSRTQPLPDDDITAGLKGALLDGASLAVLELGEPGALRVRASNRRVRGGDRAGASRYGDHLAQAAEATASQAGPILRETINALHFPDPQAVLNAGSRAATAFLRDHAAESLRSELTAVAGRAYAAVADSDSLSNEPIADDIARRTVDALLQTIGRQEQLIRRASTARGTKRLARVFGES